MATALWKISLGGGAAVTFASLGLERPVIERRSFAASELTFSHRRADGTGAQLIAYLTSVVVFRGDTVWFTGRVTSCEAGLDGAGEEADLYTVSDGWWMLERIIYQQPWVLRDETFATLTGSMSTRVVLGQDAWGRKLPVATAYAQISAWALLQGSGVVVTVNEFGGFTTPPWLEARDISCAAAFQMLAGLVPDVVCYSTPAGAMVVGRRGTLGGVGVAIATCKDIRIRPRPDLKPAGVILSILTAEENPADERSYTRETRQTAGLTSGQGVLCVTLQLGQSETVPVNLAAEYFAALNYTPWEGSLTIKEKECSRPASVGQTLNITGGRAEWSTMNAVIVSSTEYLDRGETTLTLGPAGVMEFSNFAALMEFWRLQNSPTDWPDKRHNGTEGVDDGATEAGVDGVGGGAPDVAEGDREANPDAARPWGGPGSGTPGAPGGISGKTTSVTQCDGGIQREITVFRAP